MQSLKVKDHMDRRPVTFEPGQTVAEAVQRLLTAQRIGGPVIDEQKKLVGFISQQDCLRAAVEASYHCEGVALVKELMRTEVLTVSPEDSILELAQQMLGQKPKLYPVVDDYGLLIGLIARRDILRALSTHLDTCFGKAS
ncbi:MULTISPECIES: CBS domain-containing protein [Corallincola]|uniref:CBS domain-containing protein n=3 Tax=Corallincola TaxID=1775176 RepID=A0A368NSG7_9GAMM|nr:MULTISPECIES: CBS domain-containing protein [Corallincola]RCU52644.1 CBS domain-containing protein [Corallincola holothuriorum]TAA48175.1 CBS domain-containing protein [Corallincola spongiicola]TCI03142.1 CBS domain-containing protein [Corallincola luteus]